MNLAAQTETANRAFLSKDGCSKLFCNFSIAWFLTAENWNLKCYTNTCFYIFPRNRWNNVAHAMPTSGCYIVFFKTASRQKAACTKARGRGKAGNSFSLSELSPWTFSQLSASWRNTQSFPKGREAGDSTGDGVSCVHETLALPKAAKIPK